MIEQVCATITKENALALRDVVREAQPFLREEAGLAYRAHHCGAMPREDYEVSRDRARFTDYVLDFENKLPSATPQILFESCAPIAAHLRSATERTLDKGSVQAVLDRFLEIYRKAGFTKMHPIDNIPMLPGQDPAWRHALVLTRL